MKATSTAIEKGQTMKATSTLTEKATTTAPKTDRHLSTVLRRDGQAARPAEARTSAAYQRSDEFYRKDEESAILAVARMMIIQTPNAALITLDSNGQPRARTIQVSAPEDDMTLWMATNPITRKLEQIRANPNVTLYFSNPVKESYLTVVGTASLHLDLETKRAKNFYSEAELKEAWPDYPNDFVLIQVRPRWIEVLGQGISSRPDCWRPQAVFLRQ